MRTPTRSPMAMTPMTSPATATLASRAIRSSEASRFQRRITAFNNLVPNRISAVEVGLVGVFVGYLDGLGDNDWHRFAEEFAHFHFADYAYPGVSGNIR